MEGRHRSNSGNRARQGTPHHKKLKVGSQYDKKSTNLLNCYYECAFCISICVTSISLSMPPVVTSWPEGEPVSCQANTLSGRCIVQDPAGDRALHVARRSRLSCDHRECPQGPRSSSTERRYWKTKAGNCQQSPPPPSVGKTIAAPPPRGSSAERKPAVASNGGCANNQCNSEA